MELFRELQEDDHFDLDGTEWHVHRTYDGFGPKCDYNRVVECYDPDGACRLFVVYPTEVRKTIEFSRMNRGDYEVVADSPQQTLVPDGGTERYRVVQCPGCMGLQAVPERYDEIGELYAHMTGNRCSWSGPS